MSLFWQLRKSSLLKFEAKRGSNFDKHAADVNCVNVV